MATAAAATSHGPSVKLSDIASASSRTRGANRAATGSAPRPLAARPPDWVLALLQASARAGEPPADHRVEVLEGADFSLVSAAAPCPARLAAAQIEELARVLYLSILERAAGLACPHPARLWNFIPRILEPVGDLEHRYMAFNAGRFRAYRRFYGDGFPDHMPTASGVGYSRARLVVHALTASRPAAPIHNPRQFPAHRYSLRYGPYPPCFSRAVELPLPDGRRWLLAGGTASVRGERTVHAAELEPQTRETLVNLAALIAAAERRGRGTVELDEGAVAERLARYRFLRVYLPDPAAAARVAGWLEAGFPRAPEIEVFATELCRPDLLIEIEGVAELDGGPARS